MNEDEQRNASPVGGGKPDPSWAGKTELPGDSQGTTEEWCGEWRERHPLAFLELAEMCGLAEMIPVNTSLWRETGRHDRERVNAVFESLKVLVKIDPDGRR